ncbi:hypothetical protein F5Y19DRAFT_460841 [Xylariaceae sp. FL1651]|nr:hypothetical protein F5Y19DRAFT_460841 [Xylariaceae sp. FL1651]
MAKDSKDDEKPLPKHSRHKSTGTINLLVETRRQASDQYMRAQRAENAYRARKNATIARTKLSETKTHFSQGFKHLGLGFKGLFTVVRAVPYLISERREQWRRKADVRKRQKAEEQRSKLEEKLSRDYADVDGDKVEGEGSNGKSEKK